MHKYRLKCGHSELRAVALSVLCSLLFLLTFVSFYKPDQPEQQSVMTYGPPPTPTASLELKHPDPNEKYRAVPENFKHADFKNWSYGPYRFWGKKLNLTLTQGEREYPRKEGGGGETFSLSDVIYTDVTGDERPEAIVFLSHVECGGSCDGGSALFYIYENRHTGLRRIWEYETGSMAYGCGFKSLTVSSKEITLEMFGQCWKPASSFEGTGKFLVGDVTRSGFRFNGRRFVKQRTKLTAAPARDLRGYTPEVHIID